MGYYRLHVQLNEDNPQDQIVIEALERLGNRGKSRWVRRVLYDAINEPARAELLAAIRAVERKVEGLEANGIALTTREPEPDGEPEAAAGNLDGLLARLEEW